MTLMAAPAPGASGWMGEVVDATWWNGGSVASVARRKETLSATCWLISCFLLGANSRRGMELSNCIGLW